MEYLLTGNQMKSIDTYTIKELGIPSMDLMERAATACADYILRSNWNTESICIVCGSGNNGGDGFAIGRILMGQGIDVEVVFVGNPNSCTKETNQQIKLFEQANGVVYTDFQKDNYSIVIDAVFGIGLSRNIEGKYKDVIERMNAFAGKKLAVDIASGISADSGQIMGCAFKVDATVTFQEKQLGHFLYPGAEYTGELILADIGIDNRLLNDRTDYVYSLSEDELKAFLPVRKADSNKGSFGKALIIAGSKGMCGAAYLSAHAAYMVGAGLVQIYTVEENRIPLQTLLPEAIITTYETYDEKQIQKLISWADCVCIGPGLGMSELSKKILRFVVSNVKIPCLIDADGLNILSENMELLELKSGNDVVLTPHMKELSRLCRKTISEIKDNRKEVVESLLSDYQVTLVAKDSRTLVAKPGGPNYLNLSGNSALAKGGSGDVLSGIITGLMAQKVNHHEAAIIGVYLHGLAGDIAKNEIGEYSVIARDVIHCIAKAMNQLK